MATANANRSKPANLLEVERSMSGIVLEAFKRAPGLIAHPFRQETEKLP